MYGFKISHENIGVLLQYNTGYIPCTECRCLVGMVFQLSKFHIFTKNSSLDTFKYPECIVKASLTLFFDGKAIYQTANVQLKSSPNIKNLQATVKKIG